MLNYREKSEIKELTIALLKIHVLSYRKWREITFDANGKMITEKDVKFYEETCARLHELGVKMGPNEKPTYFKSPHQSFAFE